MRPFLRLKIEALWAFRKQRPGREASTTACFGSECRGELGSGAECLLELQPVSAPDRSCRMRSPEGYRQAVETMHDDAGPPCQLIRWYGQAQAAKAGKHAL